MHSGVMIPRHTLAGNNVLIKNNILFWRPSPRWEYNRCSHEFWCIYMYNLCCTSVHEVPRLCITESYIICKKGKWYVKMARGVSILIGLAWSAWSKMAGISWLYAIMRHNTRVICKILRRERRWWCWGSVSSYEVRDCSRNSKGIYKKTSYIYIRRGVVSWDYSLSAPKPYHEYSRRYLYVVFTS